MKTAIDWTKPKEVDRITAAFPANIIGSLLPKWDEIPEDFRREHGSARAWTELCNRWFAAGLSGQEIVAKDGVDRTIALRHLGACMGSFEPKHEHKISGVAWLMSQWFELAKKEAA